MNTLKKSVGRPPKLEGGKRRNIYIDEASWEKAKEIGKGNPSEGIRVALNSHEPLPST